MLRTPFVHLVLCLLSAMEVNIIWWRRRLALLLDMYFLVYWGGRDRCGSVQAPGLAVSEELAL